MEDEDSKDYIANKLSVYSLINQFITLADSLTLGIIADRFTLWKMALITHILLILSVTLFVSYVPQGKHIYTSDSPAPIGLALGYCFTSITTGAVSMINTVLFQKAISTCIKARGLLSGTLGFSVSCGVLLIDGLGG